MLKKIIHIAVALLLLTTTAGFTVSKHYCDHHPVSVSVLGDATGCCGESHNNCCHDASAHYQLKEDFYTVAFNFKPNISNEKEIQFTKTDFISVRYKSTINILFSGHINRESIHPPLARLQRYLL